LLAVVTMSSLRRTGGFIRAAAPSDGEVYVLDGQKRLALASAPAVLGAEELLAATEARCGRLLQAAEEEAAALVAAARSEARAVHEAAYAEGHAAGFQAGRTASEAEVSSALELIRGVVSRGMTIRDEVASQATAVLGEAVVMATRRLVGEWYDADPARTAAICREALRAASGQEVISIRVHPGVVDHVRVALADVASYVQPDSAVAIGGCVIDVQHGRIDATLDSRLSLLGDAIERIAGERAA
jgi:flagellar biosynthesis/type III secretory pathway protein FliH